MFDCGAKMIILSCFDCCFSLFYTTKAEKSRTSIVDENTPWISRKTSIATSQITLMSSPQKNLFKRTSYGESNLSEDADNLKISSDAIRSPISNAYNSYTSDHLKKAWKTSKLNRSIYSQLTTFEKFDHPKTERKSSIPNYTMDSEGKYFAKSEKSNMERRISIFNRFKSSEPTIFEKPDDSKRKRNTSVPNYTMDSEAKTLAKLKNSNTGRNFSTLINTIKPLKVTIEIIQERMPNNLSVKAYSFDKLSDAFDICLISPQNDKPSKYRFNQIIEFPEFSNCDLNTSALNFKFYGELKSNERKPLGEFLYFLKTLNDIEFQDNRRAIKPVLNLWTDNIDKSLGSMEVGFSFNEINAELLVYIVRGNQIKFKSNEISNIFCFIELYKNKREPIIIETSIIEKTENPEWNEKYAFHLVPKDFNRRLILKICVCHYSQSETFIIGQLEFPSIPISLETHHWNMFLSEPDEQIVMSHNLRNFVMRTNV